MKVAYILKFLLFISLSFSSFSKESQTLRLRGQIPYVFGINYQRSADYVEFRQVSNFEFYGQLELIGQSIKFNRPIKLEDKNQNQIITVTIN